MNLEFMGTITEKVIELVTSKIIKLWKKDKLRNIDEKPFENQVNSIKEYFVETTLFERAIKESSKKNNSSNRENGYRKNRNGIYDCIKIKKRLLY